jgi:hypothetical protein
MDTPERRVWGERRSKDKVTLQIILVCIVGTKPDDAKKCFARSGIGFETMKFVFWKQGKVIYISWFFFQNLISRLNFIINNK